MGDVGVSASHLFSEEEVAEVKVRFPGLTLHEKGFLEGTFDFNAVFDDLPIADTYKIAVFATSKYPDELPLLIEVGGRTQSIADKYHLQDLRDLHHNPKSHTACLCVKPEERLFFPAGSNLVTFFEALVLPYLYGLSFYDEHGHWPWGERSHGGLGILEFYVEDSSPQTEESINSLGAMLKADDNWKYYTFQIRNPSSKKFCVCGSRRPISGCHRKAWQGIIRLHEDVNRLKLEVEPIFSRWK